MSPDYLLISSDSQPRIQLLEYKDTEMVSKGTFIPQGGHALGAAISGACVGNMVVLCT